MVLYVDMYSVCLTRKALSDRVRRCTYAARIKDVCVHEQGVENSMSIHMRSYIQGDTRFMKCADCTEGDERLK